jgi:hypothetical protein
VSLHSNQYSRAIMADHLIKHLTILPQQRFSIKDYLT